MDSDVQQFAPIPGSLSTTLKKSSLFAHIDEQSLLELAARAVVHNFKRGEIILQQGDAVGYLLVVSVGMLKVYITSPLGNRMILDLLRPGEFFGLESCLGGSASLASVEALSETQLLAVSRADLEQFMRVHPALLTAMLGAMSGMVHRRTTQVTDLVFMELHQRVAKLLLGLLPTQAQEQEAEKVGSENVEAERVVTLRLTLPDLAAVVGGEPTAVREVVATFQQLGYIELLGGRGIAIRRPEALRDHLSQGGSWAKLTQQTFHDILTGLPNRAFFGLRASSAVSRCRTTGNPGAVLFIDLDDFKKVNDTLGHAAGDELLTQVVERLRMSIRPNDTPARFGGDEFGILLEDMRSIHDAATVAQRICDSMKPVFALAAGAASVQASIGVAVFEGDDDFTIEAILESADKAMYAAKQLGKGRFVVYGADVIR